MSSDCFGLIEVECLFGFPFFGWIFAKLKTKINIGPCLLSGWGFIVFQGGSSCFFFKVQSNCNYEREAVFFFVYFVFFFFSNSSQAFLATLTDWTWDFLFCFMKSGTFFEGTARLFINVSMVFSLHLITRSQKSTKMDEFELSGCTKLRYLHDWCCLALLSFLLFGCFVLILLFVVCFVTFALFTSFSKVFLDLFSFLYCSLRVFFSEEAL